MRRSKMLLMAAAAGAVWVGGARAQAPAGGAAGPAPAAAAVGAEAKPGFFEKICTGLEKCRRKICKTPAGTMLNSMTSPLTQMTGGIIPSFCPAMPSKEDMAKSGAEGEAAQAKADAVQAAARVQAVQYLGTLDCHWHPEAEEGLVKALRTDRNECVRLAAARALCRGCCCTKVVIDALEDCISGKEKFGPYENSPRVQSVAMVALEHCLSCYRETDTEEPEKEKGKEKAPVEKGTPMTADQPGLAKPMILPAIPAPAPAPAKRYSGRPTREQVEHARHSLMVAKSRYAQFEAAQSGPVFATGQRSLMHLANYIVDGRPTPAPDVTGPVMVTSQPQLATVPTTGVVPAVVQPLAKPAPRSASPYAPAQATPVAPANVTPAVSVQPETAPIKVEAAPAAIQGSFRPATLKAVPPASVQPEMPLIQPDPTPTASQGNFRPAPLRAAPVVSAQPEAPQVKPDPTPTVIQGNFRPAPTVAETPRAHQVDPHILRCLETLRDAKDPETRHAAVKTLAACNWHEHPEAVLGLLYAARNDKHPGMRVACVRSLAAMKACTPEVMTGLRPMTFEADEWIRQETTQALAYLQTLLPKSVDAATWQTSASRKAN